MQIRFQFRRYRLPFRAVVRTAHGPWVEREGVIVRLLDASEGGSGAVGFGEAAPIPWFGTETVDEVEAGCRAIGEWINETAFEAVPKRLACLRHALADALAECRAGRDESRPEAAHAAPGAGDGDSERNSGPFDSSPSGAALRATLGVAALLPAGRTALAQIAPKAEMGFRVFKWKVGVADLADELALLDDVCAELPDGAKLRLDANGAWDRRRAERWMERCADRPVEFVEQPCYADASQGADRQRKVEDVLFGLAGDYPTPVALDESLIGNGDLERWIGGGWPGVYVVKPSLFEDLNAAMARLEKANAKVVFSSALETAIGAKTALKAAFAWKGGQAPSTGSGQAPSTGSGQAHSTGSGQGASTGSGQGHSTGSGRGASTGSGFTPSTSSGLTRSTSSGFKEVRRGRALGFGVWPLFADARFDGPFVAPYLRFEDVERIDPASLWNALS